LVNTDELALTVYRAQRRVLEIQTKLRRWSGDDPHRRFDDLYNLITDPAFLLVAWDRVRNNRGARTAGVGGVPARSASKWRHWLWPGLRWAVSWLCGTR
jgi:RNA-directed DNA polymerase